MLQPLIRANLATRARQGTSSTTGSLHRKLFKGNTLFRNQRGSLCTSSRSFGVEASCKAAQRCNPPKAAGQEDFCVTLSFALILYLIHPIEDV